MPENISIKVIGRCRPLTGEESSKGVKSVVKVSGDKILLELGGKEQSFGFDGAYSGEVRNEQIFKEKCETMLQRTTEGYNSTIMTFGATGAGKSHLMSGTDDNPGIAPQMIKRLYQHIAEKSNREFFITVSYLQAMDEKMMDLLNPHNNQMTIRHHPHKGIFVDGLSEMVVHSYDEMSEMYEQGRRVYEAGGSDLKGSRARAHSVFSITIEQKERQSSKVGVRSVLTLAEIAGFDHGGSTDPKVVAGVQGMASVLNALGGPKKGGAIPYRDSVITRVLQESLGGNAVTMVFAVVSPVDKSAQETMTTLQYAQYAKNTKNHVKMNLDETHDIINDLRDEISKLREKIAAQSQPNKDDVLKMEALVQDLQIAKRSTWEEREKQSSKYQNERKTNLANKGVLEWVQDSMKKGNRELQEKLMLLQKEKDQLTYQYKERRKVVDDLNEELQRKIGEYSKLTQSGKSSESETKKKVTAVHDLKEKLKKETDGLKRLKEQLQELTEKQKNERENAKAQITSLKGNAELRQKIEREEREHLEKEHAALVHFEIDKMKMDIENLKQDIQMKVNKGHTYSSQEGELLEVHVAEMKAEKNVTTLQIQLLEKEKSRIVQELEDVHKVHKDELEIQQLQHFQTFRSYREMFEEQKIALDQRYRQLLEDAIQDAVFLSSRNNELQDENKSQRQHIAEMKDVITKLGGRIPPEPGMTA
ncbi:kinesin-II 85 kDa subunit-like [Mytilus galloprovincialis]|uniref:kinesin-II 85 kDa subunit-like n=1 Tax=Mytilus galloprovincialis TaxID=29158 RepID=UPI003F7B8E73